MMHTAQEMHGSFCHASVALKSATLSHSPLATLLFISYAKNATESVTPLSPLSSLPQPYLRATEFAV